MIDIALLIAVVIAVTEVVKKVANVPHKYLPLVSLVLGVVGGVMYLDGDIKDVVLQGIIIGLSASGLFDQTKIIKE